MASDVSYGIHPLAGPTGGLFPREETYTLAGGPGLVPTAVYVVYGASAITLDGRNATARFSVGAFDGTTQRVVCIVGEDGDAAATAIARGRTDTDSVIQITALNDNTFSNEARAIAFGVDSVTLDWQLGSNGNGFLVFFYCNAAKVGVSTASGASTAVTGVGFQPDALIAFGVNQAITANAAFTELMLSVGYAGRLPAITQSCGVICAEDQQANTSSGEIARTNRFLTTLTSVAGVDAEGTDLTLSSFDADGFTYARSAAVAIPFVYLALDLDNRAVHCAAPLVAMGATGTEAVPGAGFTPALLLTSAVRIATQDTINGNQATLSLGASDGTVTASACARVRNNQGTSDTYSTASATSLIHLVETSAADDVIANLDSFDADGFTLDILTASSGAEARALPYMAIEERRLFVGSNEAVQISDSALLWKSSMAASETVQIADERVFSPEGGMNMIDTTEAVQISDGLVEVEYIQASETVLIEDHLTLYGTGVGVIATESIQIGDQAVAWLGVILGQTTESVSIGDDFSSGAGLVAQPGGRGGRGRTVQAGAELGSTAQAGAKKGRTHG